mmetsp:Transcript_33187/g.72510  ORF Transcript_33187/g.72510 Transcript_33187/m.72510 type:complete len:222 (-) Transcript_33187:340-1005(-)
MHNPLLHLILCARWTDKHEKIPICGGHVQDQPTKRGMTVPHQGQQLWRLLNGILLIHNTLQEVLFELSAVLHNVDAVSISCELHLTLVHNVLQRFLRSLEVGPLLRQVHHIPHVIRQNPIVWKVAVHELTHLCVALRQRGRVLLEQQNNIQHGRLLSQCYTAMFRERIMSKLVVHIIVTQRTNNQPNDVLRQSEPGQIFVGVAHRDPFVGVFRSLGRPTQT